MTPRCKRTLGRSHSGINGRDCSMSMSWAGPRSSGAPRFTAKLPPSISAPAAARRAPLLGPWFASQGRFELAGEELLVTCRELVHDLRDFPDGRIVLRQRESDDLVARLAAYA